MRDDEKRLDLDPPQAHTASAQQASLRVLQWAKENRLLARVPMEESAEAVEDTSPPVPARMFSAPHVEDIFRRRAINLVAFNEQEGKVVVFTKSRLSASERKSLPFSVDGVDIEYLHGGLAQVKGNPPPTQAQLPYWEHNGRYCCGSSIFPGNCIGAGTLGALARTTDGTLFGLTNNHVAGACNNAQPGLPIIGPGPLDVHPDHRDPFTIGRHSKLLPINDGIPDNVDVSINWDACCFEIIDHDSVCSMQGSHYDTPSIVAEPLGGMMVEKVGRTTGHTSGAVVGEASSPVPVQYVVNEYGVRKSVYFEKVFIVQGTNGQPFSRPGDSGALVVNRSSNGCVAVGMVFAGDDKGLSFILPLTPILAKLNLEIVGAFNVS